jgi:hypothetical protein
MNVEELLDRLDGVKGRHPSWHARCPAHEDDSPSLHVTQADDGRLLVHCFAGCGAADVVAAVGLTLADLCTGPHGHYLPGRNSRQRQAETAPLPAGYMSLMEQLQREKAKR